MQDRFRFRCWIKHLKQMHTHFMIDPEDGAITDIFGIKGDFEKQDEDWILMQCASLKDKNGKLIYEGDVVNWKEPDGNTTPSQNCIEVVRWDESFAGFAPFCGYYYNDFKLPTYEILGNIHENPEFFETK